MSGNEAAHSIGGKAKASYEIQRPLTPIELSKPEYNSNPALFTSRQEAPPASCPFFFFCSQPSILASDPITPPKNAVALVAHLLPADPRQSNPAETLRDHSHLSFAAVPVGMPTLAGEHGCFEITNPMLETSPRHALPSPLKFGIKLKGAQPSTYLSWAGRPSCRPSRPAHCTRGGGPRPAS